MSKPFNTKDILTEDPRKTRLNKLTIENLERSNKALKNQWWINLVYMLIGAALTIVGQLLSNHLGQD